MTISQISVTNVCVCLCVYLFYEKKLEFIPQELQTVGQRDYEVSKYSTLK